MAGGKFSEANLFGITLRESANDGSDFTNPDADYRRVFLGEDGELHKRDSAGAVTGFGGSGIAASLADAAGDTLVATAADTWAKRVNNLAASVAPAVTDDSGDGYSIGSRWIDTTADKEYVATDVSVGAAVWKETTGAMAVAVLQDQEAQNTQGGTFTSGAWQTRVLNTEVSDASAIVTLSSNRFTPIAGTYLILARAPAYQVRSHQLRIQNVTAATTAAIGGSQYVDPGDTVVGDATVEGVIVANGTDAYELQHQAHTTANTNGLGNAANFTTEVYASVTLIKIA